MKKESEKGGKVLESKKGNVKKERDGDGSPTTVKEKKTPEEQKPQVKTGPVFQQESKGTVVKKKKKKGIEHPESPVFKIKQETDGNQHGASVKKKRKHSEDEGSKPTESLKTEQVEGNVKALKHKKKKYHQESFSESSQTEQEEQKLDFPK